MSAQLLYTVVKSEPLVPDLDLDLWEEEQTRGVFIGGDLFIGSIQPRLAPQLDHLWCFVNARVAFVDAYTPALAVSSYSTHTRETSSSIATSFATINHNHTVKPNNNTYINYTTQQQQQRTQYDSIIQSTPPTFLQPPTSTDNGWLEQPMDVLALCTEVALGRSPSPNASDVPPPALSYSGSTPPVHQEDQPRFDMPDVSLMETVSSPLSIVDEVEIETVDVGQQQQQPDRLAILRDIRTAAAEFEKSQSPESSFGTSSGRSSISAVDRESSQSSEPDESDVDDPSWSPMRETSADNGVTMFGPRRGTTSTAGESEQQQQKASSSSAPKRSKRSQEEKRERKKQQNREAATRYRIKKRSIKETIEDKMEVETKRNRALRSKVEDAMYEIKYLKQLILEVQQAQNK